MNYSQALDIIKNGGKVSCDRWGNEGQVFVEKLNIKIDFVNRKSKYDFDTLVLTDMKRKTMVAFAPSVENQLEDKWYEVIIMDDGTTKRKELILERLVRERLGEDKK